MRFKLYLENEYGNKINMTARASSGYTTSNIDGLYPPEATITTAGYAAADGSYLNNAYVEKRNIVISFEMRGRDIEKRRQELYRVVQTGHYIKVYYFTKRTHVYAEGYVETCEIDNFTDTTNGQISIICPDPYWYDEEENVYEKSEGQVDSAFHFISPNETANEDAQYPIGTYDTEDPGIITLNVYNDGDDCGFSLYITDLNNDDAPLWERRYMRWIQVENETTGDIFNIRSTYYDTVFMAVGDTVVVHTQVGKKYLGVYSAHNEELTDYFSFVYPLSHWVYLTHGWNKIIIRGIYEYDRDTDEISSYCTRGLKVKIVFAERYLGV